MSAPRILIVTGTSRGIGLGLAERFLARGDTVFGCSRGPSPLQHPSYVHAELDVCDEARVVSFVRDAERRAGRIDGLVNNAGIASMNAALLTPLPVARQILETNTLGSFLFMREVAKTMVRRRTGRIVNLTTVATPLDLEGEALYAASKAAVESLTRIAARELGRSGITVNAVGPTPVPTDLVRNVPAAKMDALLARQAIPRWGTVDDVHQVVEFFLAPASDFVTGQVIYLGGVT